jgi:hypothetical protein
MAPKDELAYLKSLVAQLNSKIDQLEQKAKDTVGAAVSAVTPAQQLRTILIGPPGAGACFLCFYDASCARLTRKRRQGHPGAAHPRKVLRLPPRDGRHAARAGAEADAARC